jgi:hypothetical protein
MAPLSQIGLPDERGANDNGRVIAFDRRRLWAALLRGAPSHWLLDGLLTLVGVYLIHFTFTKLFVVGAVGPEHLVRPYSRLPAWIFIAWDATYYRGLFENIHHFAFPPGYPLTLRGICEVFGIGRNAFAKSSILLNILSHAIIAVGLTWYLRNDPRTRTIPAWAPALLIFFFPWHNVFFAAYAESFFLALTVLAFCFRAKGWLATASLIAGASLLVRTMGTFLVFALIAEQVFYCLRDRKIYWRKVLLASSGLVFVVGWHVFLYSRGTTAMREVAPWVDDMVNGTVPPGQSPFVWVLKYLCWQGRWIDVLPFWLGIAAMTYCAVKRRPLEFFYIALFYLSLAMHIYRPFPWSRYVSVLFPLQIMLCDFFRERPRALAVITSLSIIHCYRIQIELFAYRAGEP